MKILISHNNYPSQFRRIAPRLHAEGHDVVFLSQAKEWHCDEPNGFRLINYSAHRDSSGEFIHPYLRRLEPAILQGQAVHRVAQELHLTGWYPDVIINHVGFGNGLFLSEVFPQAKRVCLFEWYYNAHGSDVDFLTGGTVEPDRALRLKIWNAQTLLELADCDLGIVPTHWQLSQFPQHLRSRLRVIHEGIDTELLSTIDRFNRKRPACLPDDKNIEVLTYVSRGFEEYRGFPQALSAIEKLQSQRPNLHVLIVGSDLIAYGGSRCDARTWGDWAKQELTLDPARTHWMGALQTPEYLDVLAHSDVHLYLTVPFVLSWSLLEAMASGCCIVASNTQPVQEVLQNDVSAALVDFFDVDAMCASLTGLLDNPSQRARLSTAARSSSLSYSSDRGFRQWLEALSSFGHQTAHAA